MSKMKNFILLSLAFLILFSNVAKSQGVNKNNTNTNSALEMKDLELKIRGDFRLFLEELYKERERGKKEAQALAKKMTEVLDDNSNLIKESKNEIKEMSYNESRNLLIASIFLWVSITVFIIMNLIFANNLKKELYFLRNGLLRSEIKDNMLNLLANLEKLNLKLDSMDNKEVK